MPNQLPFHTFWRQKKTELPHRHFYATGGIVNQAKPRRQRDNSTTKLNQASHASSSKEHNSKRKPGTSLDGPTKTLANPEQRGIWHSWGVEAVEQRYKSRVRPLFLGLSLRPAVPAARRSRDPDHVNRPVHHHRIHPRPSLLLPLHLLHLREWAMEVQP